MKKQALIIFDHYGYENQLKKLHEEVYELIESVIKYENGKDSIEHVTGELGDVEFLLYQFRSHYKIKPRKIMNIRRFKARRQLGRIANENSRVMEIQ